MTDYDALEKRLLIELEGTDIHWAGEDPCPALVPYQPCNCHTGQVAKRAADAIRDLRAGRDALREELLGKCGEARICHALATTRSENKLLLAERNVLLKALEEIMHAVKTPPFTNMSRADMREIARAALTEILYAAVPIAKRIDTALAAQEKP